jgi:hypothetical protein
MSRSTKLEEANKMLGHLKEYSQTMSEEKAWVAMLDELLKLPDIRSK